MNTDQWLDPALAGGPDADAYDLLCQLEDLLPGLTGTAPSRSGGSAYDEALDDA